ncbi:MAG: rRNA large subunit methyltransferase I [Bacteroidetes bacterium 37-13]|nr:MAG: rRNA large subunit methyltransferase I [Bacteroidetes bacterium 37-13]
MSFVKITLHANKTEAVRRFHPWVFSGAIKNISGEPNEGDVVEVTDEKGNFLGLGHYAKGSIAVRIFSFANEKNVEQIFIQKIEAAIALRKQIGLWQNNITNAFRLIHGEGDDLPGLIVDVYGNTAVLQAHSKGMFQQRELIAQAIKKASAGVIENVYSKSDSALKHKEKTDGLLLGNSVCEEISEYKLLFKVDIPTGQKTGFFIDQRENRRLLARYAENKKVLNTFCYTGGFSVYAAKTGAALIHSVDSSAKATQLTNENMVLNECANYETFTADVFDFMNKQAANNFYDIIVLDPPAFAKNHNARHQAIQAYKRLNMVALQKIAKGGLIFTFSCSQAVSQEMFEGAVTAASIETGRKSKIIHRLMQPPDHPVNIFHPEGEYLKGLVLTVQ